MGWYVAGTYTMMVVGKVLPGNLADMVGRRVMWMRPTRQFDLSERELPGPHPRQAAGTSYNLGRVGSALSPLLIGMVATTDSIGLGIGLLGISYAVCALVPGIFIREKMFDTKAVEEASTA